MKLLKRSSLCLAFVLFACAAPVYADSGTARFQKIQTYSSAYTDMNDVSNYYREVVAVYEYGVFDESGFGSFRPDDPLASGEAVAYATKLYRLSNGISPDIAPSDPFVWYSGYVDYAAEEKIIEFPYWGVSKFETPESGGAFLSLLSKIPSEDDLAPIDESITSVPGMENRREYGAMLLFYQSGVLWDSDRFDPDATITRGEAMRLIARILDPDLRRP
jgi:hypothetical protein